MRAYFQNVHIRVCHCSPINNPIFIFPVSCVLTVRTFMNHWLLMGHWLFQSQQEVGEGAAGSPWGTQTHGRSIIHGSPWACSEHWHPTCLNQTGPVSLMPLGRSTAQVNVGVGGRVGEEVWVVGGGLGVIAVVRSERGEWQERHHFVLLFNKSISVFLSAGGGQSVSGRERESEQDIVQKHLSYCVLFVCECECLWI